MPTTAYISRRVVFPGETRPACVVTDSDSGLITRITEADTPPYTDFLLDLGDDALLPGLVDTHVHLNEPGRTEWEGFLTGTRAAAAAGITTLVDMPLNCLPETTTVAALQAKRAAAAGQCFVDYRLWGGAVGVEGHGNQPDLLPLAHAGVPGFKCFLLYPGCDGFGLIDEPDLRAAMPLIAQTGLPLLVHAELPGPLASAAHALEGHDYRRYATYLASRPDEAEVAAFRLMIQLCREFGTRVHIVHVSSAQVLPLLRDARAEGLPITAETCPHYLVFAAEDIPDGATLFKCAPPIRSRANNQLLWQALEDGTLDLIASDHSPCPPAMKRLDEGSFLTAWGGIASLSVGLPILWTHMAARNLPLHRLAQWMSQAPAALAGLSRSKGRIAEGFDADLVVLSTRTRWTITPEDLHFRHAVSPYVGMQSLAQVSQTILHGVRIDHHAQPRGREAR